MAYLVHDALASAGVRLLTFNSVHLRMSAVSRKKTDRAQSAAYPGNHAAYPINHARPRIGRVRDIRDTLE